MTIKTSWRRDFRLGNRTIPVNLDSVSREVRPGFIQVREKDTVSVKESLLQQKQRGTEL